MYAYIHIDIDIRIRVHRFSTSGADSLWDPPGLGSSQQRRLPACAAAAPGGRGAAHLRQGRLAAARAAPGVGCLVDVWWMGVGHGDLEDHDRQGLFMDCLA